MSNLSIFHLWGGAFLLAEDEDDRPVQITNPDKLNALLEDEDQLYYLGQLSEKNATAHGLPFYADRDLQWYSVPAGTVKSCAFLHVENEDSPHHTGDPVLALLAARVVKRGAWIVDVFDRYSNDLDLRFGPYTHTYADPTNPRNSEGLAPRWVAAGRAFVDVLNDRSLPYTASWAPARFHQSAPRRR